MTGSVISNDQNQTASVAANGSGSMTSASTTGNGNTNMMESLSLLLSQNSMPPPAAAPSNGNTPSSALRANKDVNATSLSINALSDSIAALAGVMNASGTRSPSPKHTAKVPVPVGTLNGKVGTLGSSFAANATAAGGASPSNRALADVLGQARAAPAPSAQPQSSEWSAPLALSPL